MKALRRAAWMAVAGSAAAAPAYAQLTMDEVVRTTLASSAPIAQARAAVEAAQGGLRSARGAFDPRMTARVITEQSPSPLRTADGLTAPRTETLQYRLGIARPFRSGVVVTPTLAFQREQTSIAASDPFNAVSAGVDLTVPTMRGRGGGFAAGRERAAELTYEAGEAGYRHQRATGVLRSAEAYWAYLAATHRATVLAGAEERARKLVDDTRKLVESDERPSADLVPVTAHLASARAARLAGEQGLRQARQQLELAMGSEPTAAGAPAPATPFPNAGAAAETPLADVRRAAARRADLVEAEKHRLSAQAMSRGLRSELRPQLDLNLHVGYSGYGSGGGFGRMVPPFNSERTGMEARAEISYGAPLGNRSASGAVMEQAAAERSATIAAAELGRRIQLEVALAAETLRRSAEEMAQADEAVALYARSVHSETQRFRLGTATLFDIMYAENGLTNATLARIDAQLRQALAIARFRFQTGDLSPEGGEAPSAESLTRWPGGKEN